jgi:hypothetical protein
VIYTANKPEKFLWGGGRVVIFLKQIFANQYLYLSENKSLVIGSCSVEQVQFQVVKFV